MTLKHLARQKRRLLVEKAVESTTETNGSLENSVIRMYGHTQLTLQDGFSPISVSAPLCDRTDSYLCLVRRKLLFMSGRKSFLFCRFTFIFSAATQFNCTENLILLRLDTDVLNGLLPIFNVSRKISATKKKCTPIITGNCFF